MTKVLGDLNDDDAHGIDGLTFRKDENRVNFPSEDHKAMEMRNLELGDQKSLDIQGMKHHEDELGDDNPDDRWEEEKKHRVKMSREDEIGRDAKNWRFWDPVLRNSQGSRKMKETFV